MEINHRLQPDVASRLPEEAAHLAECHGADPFEPASAAADAWLAFVVAEQRILAEMNMQDHLGPQLAQLQPRRLNDQSAPSRFCRSRGLHVWLLRFSVTLPWLRGFSVQVIRLAGSGWAAEFSVQHILGNCCPVVGRVWLVVDGFVGLLQFSGRTLLIAELPQQLQRQRRLSEDANGLRSAYIH